jgi:hypothetical protein
MSKIHTDSKWGIGAMVARGSPKAKAVGSSPMFLVFFLLGCTALF